MVCMLVRILMAFSLAVAVSAATVTGTFKLADGTAYTSTVTFRPVSSPSMVGADVVTGADIKVTPSSGGYVSTSLSAGYYSVYLGSTRRFTIAVPSGSDAVDVTSILTTPAWFVPGEAGASGIITNTYAKATTNAPGTVLIDAASTNPVVYLKESVDALVAPLGSRINGLQLVASESALTTTDPTNGYSARVFTATSSADWIWNAFEGGADVSGERVRPTNYVTGSWIKTTAWATSKSLGASKGAALDSSGQLTASTATKTQVDNTKAQFATVADMIASGSNWTTNTVVSAGGRVTALDGGGGDFRYVSSSVGSTNWGTIFASSSSSFVWQRVQDGNIVNSRWYALVMGTGNGVLNTTKIQQALDYTGTLEGGQFYIADYVAVGEGATAGVGLVMPKNTRIIGQPASPFSELATFTPGASTYKGGYAGGFYVDNGANITLLKFDSVNGYLRQTSQTIWDGTIATNKYYVNSGLYGIMLCGNSPNQSNTARPLVYAESLWNITIQNCGFVNAAGPVCWFRDCNGIIFRENNIVTGRRLIVDDCGDYDFSDNWFYGSYGPNWLFLNSWKGTFSNNQTGNSVAGHRGTISGVSGNVLTAAAHGMYSTHLVWIYSTGSLPSPLVSTRPYYVIRLTADTFSLASTLANASAGTAVTLTTAGSGTMTFTDGPSVSHHLVSPSGGGTFSARSGTVRNAFVGNRSDQNFEGGWVLDGASENTFAGNYVIEGNYLNSGSQTAVILTNSAVRNIINGFTVDSSFGLGISVGDNCDANFFGANSINATNRIAISSTGTSGNFYGVAGIGSSTNIAIGSINASSSITGTSITVTNAATAGTVAVGSTASGTVATFTGGTAGAPITTFVRSGQPTIGVKASGGWLFSDETNFKTLGQLSWQSPNSVFTLGNPAASSPSPSYIRGEVALGTDIEGRALNLSAGIGTGSASTASTIIGFFTPVAGSSGSTQQSLIERVRINSTLDATLLPLWINHNGTLKQVQVGAADSGGTGFRMLRISN